MFKDILADILIEKNLSQSEFARIVGIKQSQVSEWLKGKASPGYDMLRKLSVSLCISPSYLLGLDFDKPLSRTEEEKQHL